MYLDIILWAALLSLTRVAKELRGYSLFNSSEVSDVSSCVPEIAMVLLELVHLFNSLCFESFCGVFGQCQDCCWKCTWANKLLAVAQNSVRANILRGKWELPFKFKAHLTVSVVRSIFRN